MRIALAATARKVSPEEMQPAIAMLQEWGMQVLVPDGLYAEEHQLAGSDAHRARQLQSLLDDPSVDAILCCRGGYGTVRIIDQLDFTAFQTKPKPIVGYSDVTVLHSHLHTLGFPTLHATMPINMDGTPNPATESLHSALLGHPLSYSIPHHPLNRTGKATAPVVGGNLSILYSLLGSPSYIDTRGKILLLEDLDEYLYHIDRMMQALRRAGMLEGLAGLIVGPLTDMHDNAIPFGHTAEEIVRQTVAGYSYPVLFNAPFGHIGPRNLALPLGVPIEMEVSTQNAQLSTLN